MQRHNFSSFFRACLREFLGAMFDTILTIFICRINNLLTLGEFPHVTPLYPQKLALTSPTGGGHSVGIVRVRTKATEFSLVSVQIFVPASILYKY